MVWALWVGDLFKYCNGRRGEAGGSAAQVRVLGGKVRVWVRAEPLKIKGKADKNPED